MRNPYAHIEVVVAFLVVNFCGFLVITRHHRNFERRHSVKMNPTGLTELSKPKFSGSNRRKTSKLDISTSRKNQKINDYFRVSV